MLQLRHGDSLYRTMISFFGYTQLPDETTKPKKKRKIEDKSIPTMGGNTLQNEPSNFPISEAASAILQRAGWLTYVHKLQGNNTEIAIEFLQNLQDGKTRVNDRTIPVTEEIIAIVSGIPAQGERWVEKHLLLQEAIALYQDPDEPLE